MQRSVHSFSSRIFCHIDRPLIYDEFSEFGSTLQFHDWVNVQLEIKTTIDSGDGGEVFS